MNFHQLRIFHAVAKHESFTRAAKELLLTQPAVSIQVQRLEEMYQTRLFDRIGKKVILTEAGKMLSDYTATILDLSKQADSALQDLRGLKTGNLTIGAGLTLGAYYVPRIIERFSKKYPQISIRMSLNNSSQVVENILSFKDDLGFVARVHHQEKLAVIPFFRENLVLITSSKHPVARKKTLSIHEIEGERFILRERGSATREVVEETLQRCQVPIKVVMELGSNEAIKAAVLADLGISIISNRVVLEEVKMKRLITRSFRDTRIERDLYIVHHKDKYLSSPAKEFIRCAKMEFK
ncbi:MAG: LysR family transcriptional regulator [Proteobacteria bacterium]|nr:LysR family transcriptional regulator [Pseudomonadota bacterium]NIS68649.1 LysR family transcriptional regulator [Pseudomonadota bacterium]